MNKILVSFLFFTFAFLFTEGQNIEGVYTSYISKNMGGYNISISEELAISKDANNFFRYKVIKTTIDEYNGSVPNVEITEGKLKKINNLRYNFIGGNYGERDAYFILNKRDLTNSLSQLTVFFAPQRGSSMAFTKQVSSKIISNEQSVKKQNFVTIGKQIWMNENLDVDTFRNGDSIPHAKTREEWIEAGENRIPSWCYYQDDPIKGKKYGKLYNWYAVTDPRGLAPYEWHVPNSNEWTELINYLGGDQVAGFKMKSIAGWNGDGNGSNESKFSGLPGGYRSSNYDFDNVNGFSYDEGINGNWWSSDDNLGVVIYYGNSSVVRGKVNVESGLSVRCIKNNGSLNLPNNTKKVKFFNKPQKLILPDYKTKINLKNLDFKIKYLSDDIYPIGWSPDGKFAFLIHYPNEASDYDFTEFFIKDMISNKIIFNESTSINLDEYYNIIGDPIQKEMGVLDSTNLENYYKKLSEIDIVDYIWKELEVKVSGYLNKYNINQSREFKLLSTPFKRNQKIVDFKIFNNIGRCENYDESCISSTSINIIVNNNSFKKLSFQKYEECGPLTNKITGYFKSPYQDLVALVYITETFGYEKLPTVLKIELIGCNLSQL